MNITGFTDKFKQNSVGTIAIVVFAALVVTLTILISTGVLTRQNSGNLNFLGGNSTVGNDDDSSENNNDTEYINQIAGINQVANASDSSSNSSTNFGDLRMFTTVNIPILIESNDDDKIEGVKRECGTVLMVERNISATPAPLNAAYQELFRFKSDLDFYTGNYLSKNHPDLKFDKAIIENKIAKIYLEGKMSQASNDCDQNRVKILLEETALQYKTVEAVEIYLNGKLL